MIVGITCGGPALVERITAALEAGLDRVLIREPALPAGVEALARTWHGRVVLHARMPGAAELARALPVALHQPADGPTPTGVLWSRSTHSREEATAAMAAGAAWVLLSPIWVSPSKPGDLRPPLGAEALGWTRGAVALGGVRPDRIAACRAAGAIGVAGMGGLFGAPDVARAAAAWRAAWDAAA